MNTAELKLKLEQLGVKPAQYSLSEELDPDRIILFYNNISWEVFYLDERGGRNDQRYFSTESDACDYVYQLFIDSKETERKFGLNI